MYKSKVVLETDRKKYYGKSYDIIYSKEICFWLQQEAGGQGVKVSICLFICDFIDLGDLNLSQMVKMSERFSEL